MYKPQWSVEWLAPLWATTWFNTFTYIHMWWTNSANSSTDAACIIPCLYGVGVYINHSVDALEIQGQVCRVPTINGFDSFFCLCQRLYVLYWKQMRAQHRDIPQRPYTTSLCLQINNICRRTSYGFDFRRSYIRLHVDRCAPLFYVSYLDSAAAVIHFAILPPCSWNLHSQYTPLTEKRRNIQKSPTN